MYFTSDGVDIDECAANNGGCSTNADCINTIGSFTCACKVGYAGDGVNCTGKSSESKILSVLYVVEVWVGQPVPCVCVMRLVSAPHPRWVSLQRSPERLNDGAYCPLTPTPALHPTRRDRACHSLPLLNMYPV